jgi:hypothetical protein
MILTLRAMTPGNTGHLGNALHSAPRRLMPMKERSTWIRQGRRRHLRIPYVEYANQGETEKSISLLEDGLSKNPRSARKFLVG